MTSSADLTWLLKALVLLHKGRSAGYQVVRQSCLRASSIACKDIAKNTVCIPEMTEVCKAMAVETMTAMAENGVKFGSKRHDRANLGELCG
jgi:hypothetical protein